MAALFAAPGSGGSKALAETAVEREAAERLEAVLDEEQTVLAALFTLEQEIESARQEAAEAEDRIRILEQERTAVLGRIDEETASLESHRRVLGSLLAAYQKTGPGTFLGILLEAQDLSDFLRRLNLLRDFSRRSGEAVADIDEARSRLEQEQAALAGRLASLAAKQEELAAAIGEGEALVLEQEAYLASLEEERGRYEGLLADASFAWQALKPVFAQASAGFSDLASSGGLPEDAVRTAFTLQGLQAYITDDAFNGAIESHPDLPAMAFTFGDGWVVLAIPERQLALRGRFTVDDQRILSFEASEGTFYGLPLEQASLRTLFDEGGLALDLGPLLEGGRVLGADTRAGELVLSIGISLF